MRIALLQARGPDPDLTTVGPAAADAAARGADVLVLPELVIAGYGAPFPAPDPGLPAALGDLAARHGIALVAAEPQERAITALAVAAGGTLLATHRKSHLWRDERAAFEPGDGTPRVVDIAGLRCGLAVCYEIEFGEVARGLALAGAQVLLVPTALDDPAVARILVPARAFENRVAVAYANQVGRGFLGERSDGRGFCGESVIVGPDGAARASAGPEGEGLLVADVDTADLERARTDVDYLADRRPETYRLGPA